VLILGRNSDGDGGSSDTQAHFLALRQMVVWLIQFMMINQYKYINRKIKQIKVYLIKLINQSTHKISIFDRNVSKYINNCY
jgi:hypothetical protein